eukprot:COSAG04_NODE_9635_length_846_cov_0.807229_1_plen_57_part_10
MNERSRRPTRNVRAECRARCRSSGKRTLALFAHPDHLPRVYRSSIAIFHGQIDAALF